MSGAYSYSQQKKDFLKAEFVYALKLKQHLADGSITQEYYDTNIHLSEQSLENPYAGWIDEFNAAIESEDITWLANQLGEDADQLSSDITKVVTKTVTGVASGAVKGVVAGALENPLGSATILVILGGLVLVLAVIYLPNSR